MKKTPALLQDPTKQTYQIEMQLQEKQTARFEYSDRDMAREHYEQLRAQGVVGGLAIKQIEFKEISL